MGDGQKRGRIVAVSASPGHTFTKPNQDRIVLLEGLGVDIGDHVGQRLRLLGGGNYWARNAGTCRIVSLMPFEGTALFYRVRSETESFERVVAEADLATVSSIA